MRPGRSWFNHDPPYTTGREGHWDGRASILVFGWVLPLALIAWAIADLVRGTFYLPARRLAGWVAFEFGREPTMFVGMIVLKLAAAALAFTVMAVGNHPRFGWHAEPIAAGFAVLAGIGLVLLFVGAAA